MCSWCWAYRPTLEALLTRLSDPEFAELSVQHVVGGLAPDSDQPMPVELQSHLQGIWRRIQQVVPGTRFNFDFWTKNVPRRSTWQACRAVLAADALSSNGEAMTQAIQRAYYLDARNPSDSDTLISLAVELGMDADEFARCLASADTEARLQEDFRTTHRIGAQGFPSLFLELPHSQTHRLPLDYASADTTLTEIARLCQL